MRAQENANCPRTIAAPQLTNHLNKVRSASRMQNMLKSTPKYEGGFVVPETIKKGKG